MLLPSYPFPPSEKATIELRSHVSLHIISLLSPRAALEQQTLQCTSRPSSSPESNRKNVLERVMHFLKQLVFSQGNLPTYELRIHKTIKYRIGITRDTRWGAG